MARIGGADDHRRSAFGRYVAEADMSTLAGLLEWMAYFWERMDRISGIRELPAEQPRLYAPPPGGFTLRLRGYAGQALGFGAVEGDLDLLDRCHRFTIDACIFRPVSAQPDG